METSIENIPSAWRGTRIPMLVETASPGPQTFVALEQQHCFLCFHQLCTWRWQSCWELQPSALDRKPSWPHPLPWLPKPCKHATSITWFLYLATLFRRVSNLSTSMLEALLDLNSFDYGQWRLWQTLTNISTDIYSSEYLFCSMTTSSNFSYYSIGSHDMHFSIQSVVIRVDYLDYNSTVVVAF